MKTTVLHVCLVAALSSAGLSQEPNAAVKEAIEANDRAYEAAYAKGDVKALAGFFAEDADYTADTGRTFSGREEISGAIRSGLVSNPGAKLVISAETVKVLTPETVLEKGSTTVTSGNGESTGANYTAIHIKKDGQWKISQLIESPMPDLTPKDYLEELAWLVGEWEDAGNDDGTTVRGQYAWARGQSYLTRNVTVKQGDEVTLEGWQIIGWDPLEEKLRSWTFDSEGGFASGHFTRDGNRWLLREVGYASDGTRSGADITLSKKSADLMTWESNNRTLNGNPQPSLGKLEIKRVKGN